MTDKNLLLLFDKPQEPIFLLKGDEKKTSFIVPQDYLSDKFKPLGPQVVSRFGEDADELVNVNNVQIPPMDDILEIEKDQHFSLFIEKHRNIAGKLIKIFLGASSKEDLQAIAIYAREHANPQLFNYALSVALLHRKDTTKMDVPPIVHHFPDKFVENNTIGKVREQSAVVPQKLRTPIEIPKDFTASDLEEEHRLAYFREDIGVNLHHWHWHLVYPTTGGDEVVSKDRRGELFYYMHQQIIARYNFERLANGLKRVERLINFDEPIEEAYFPKLDRLVSSRPYAGRVANQKMQNLKRVKEGSFVDVDDLKRWRDTILGAIHLGVVKDSNNKEVTLDEFKGIDILGNLIEASDISINKKLYGDLHNQGHNILSLIHDPEFKNKEEPSVMGDVATAMRDPVFYRWHNFIDDIFQRFKASLPRYTENQLNFPGVEVTNIQVETSGGSPNTLTTFWQQSDVDVSKGLDFLSKGTVFVRFTHLNHKEFVYRITVSNKSNVNKRGTCRIFLAPKHDERGVEWAFRDQKNMFIELDKFEVNLKQGPNTIMRSSTQSSVTIPFERSYRNLNLKPKDDQGATQFDFCGCGWPHNMLIPKGTAGGMECQVFVMISDYNDDKVDQGSTEGVCNDAYSYCGLKDKLYPDRRSMGYPFDRQPRKDVNTLTDFLTSNMRVQDVTIKFENKTLRPKST